MSHCKRSKKCVTKQTCEAEINVQTDVIPNVRCERLGGRPTQFDVDLDFDLNPRCRVVQKKKSKDGCGCSYTVHVDFDCEPKVKYQPCAAPSADYKLTFDLDYSTKCNPKPKRHRRPRKEECSSYVEDTCSEEEEEACSSYGYDNYNWGQGHGWAN